MVRNIETAYHLDPIRPNYIYLVGQAYLESGRERQALEHWRKTERLAPGPTYRSMTEYSLLMGDIAKARELHAKFEKLQPTHPWVTYMGGFIEALAGEREKALEAVRKIDDANWGSVSYAYKAYIYSALGDMDGYFENMDRALEEHTIVPTIVMYSPLLAKAREDQRYQELVDKLRRQVGLA
jgi:tetratricopeptide (TPR) repeat protein